MNGSRLLTILALTALTALPGAAGTATGATSAAPPASAGEPAFALGEVVVRFEGREAGQAVTLPEGVAVRDAERALERNPHVAWAAPDYIARASAEPYLPNDPGRGGRGDWQQLQWHFLPCGSICGQEVAPGLESFGGIDATGAWANLIDAGRPAARGVRIAVVDTGIAYRDRGKGFRRSPDFSARQFLRGRDFVGDDDVPLDLNGHGTHVAGTIAERTNNRRGVTGLAHRARLIPIRALDRYGEGRSSDVADGIRWATKHGARLINLSLQFGRKVTSCTDVPGVCEAIENAYAKGIVVVASAGNGPGNAVSFPGRAPHAIAVAATTVRGCLAEYSNFGTGLDVVAPGGGSDMVLPSSPQCEPTGGPSEGIVQLTLTRGEKGNYRKFGYPFTEGTSMASAHVAGTAALTWAALRAQLGRRPTPDEVEQRITSTARKLGNRTHYGAGLIDARAATEPATGR